MKVSKDMVNEGLRSKFNLLRIPPFLLKRKWGINLLNFSMKFTKGKNIEGLHNEEIFIPSKDGEPDIRIRIFKPLNPEGKLPVLFYFHGGGIAIGNPEISSVIIKRYIQKRPCCVIAPDYRKSLSSPYPAAFNDCYNTLLWAKENASELNIHDSKFVVAGHSAGGGLTAAVTLKARDTNDVDIAFQMPMYPMIDDRLTTDSAKNMQVSAFDSGALAKCWDYYLKELKDGNKSIPNYAVPGKNNDYKNFPPTITFVGEFDPLKEQTKAYVEDLKKEGIPVLFKFYNGCFHGFEDSVPNADISKDAINFTYSAFAEYYDRFVLK